MPLPSRSSACERAEPTRGGLGERGAGLGHQVAVGLRVAAADAAAQLVQLGEAEAVRAEHHHRVRPRHVEPALDDARGEQDVALAGREADHRLVDLARRHLAVRDAERELGQRPS